MSKHSTAGKRKHVTLIPQKLEIIKRLESGKSQSVVRTSHSIGSSRVYNIKKHKDQLQLFIILNESVKGLYSMCYAWNKLRVP